MIVVHHLESKIDIKDESSHSYTTFQWIDRLIFRLFNHVETYVIAKRWWYTYLESGARPMTTEIAKVVVR